MRIRVLNPCHESWEAMQGRGQTRKCASCACDVHDLTSLSDAEAVDYVLARPGPICVRVASIAAGIAMAACASPRPATNAGLEADASAPVAAVAPMSPVDVAAASDAAFTEAAEASAPAICMGTALLMSTQILFPPGSAQPVSLSVETIERLLKRLSEMPPEGRMEVDGYAGHDEKSAQHLSEARAREIVARLVKAGADPKRLVARGFGAASASSQKGSTSAETHERRVEINCVEQPCGGTSSCENLRSR